MMAGASSLHPPSLSRARRAAIAAACALFCVWLAMPQPAAAQTDFLTFRQQVRPAAKPGPSLLKKSDKGDAQMLVKANEINYDTAPGRLRPEDQAAAGRRQFPPDRGRRQGHLWRDHRFHR